MLKSKLRYPRKPMKPPGNWVWLHSVVVEGSNEVRKKESWPWNEMLSSLTCSFNLKQSVLPVCSARLFLFYYSITPYLLPACRTYIQGDTSGSSQPPVDIKTKVVFQHMLLILKRNFCFDVNRRLGTTWWVTLYTSLKMWSIFVPCFRRTNIPCCWESVACLTWN